MLTAPKLTNTSKEFGIPASTFNPYLEQLGAPHLDSFNYMLDGGLKEAVKTILPVHFTLASGVKVKLFITDAVIVEPKVPPNTIGVRDDKIYPTECRQRGSTYKGKLVAKVGWSINGIQQPSVEKELGEIPIMIKSKKCHLSKMTPKQLVQNKEHEQEWGGYFIVKGHERLVRMLIMTRKNYPIAIQRATWKQKGSLFTDLGILIRTVTTDNTDTTNILHCVSNGTAKLMFKYRKVMYYIPIILMLKSLVPVSDKHIFDCLIAGCEDNTYYKNCIFNMLRAVHEEGLHSHDQCKAYIGKMFRVKLSEMPEYSTDSENCDFVIKHCILIHLDNPQDKFNLLVFMTKKLFLYADNKCATENADSPMMQECLLGGHLYLQVLKEKIYMFLVHLSLSIKKRAKGSETYIITMQELMAALKVTSKLEHPMEYFIATGNVKTNTGLGLMQISGLTICVENINRLRYMSHFRAIHRGSFFQELRTTEARQLLPEAWGFICPVHTPDGAPCGLLNHLTMNCVISKHPDPKLLEKVPSVIFQLGMLPITNIKDWKKFYTVMLDGRIIGAIEDDMIIEIVNKLRIKKIKEEVPNTMEIVLVQKKKVHGQYPGLYLFTGPSRMMRPVKNLAANKVELIGTFEQIYIDLCINLEEAHANVTHQELNENCFLSNLARLIPLPENNQSPRNMYQCQMSKQTMGTPIHTWRENSETKLYRLTTPATPLFRPVHHDNIKLDDYAMGTNAIVAVISYTGYDMEDAMVINKSAYDRGFAAGMVYSSHFEDLPNSKSYFMRDPSNKSLAKTLDPIGLPYPGILLNQGDPYCSYYDGEQCTYKLKTYHEKESVYVDTVKLCGTLHATESKRASITFRIPRNPNVGDKFASRAGQKGICSMLWPAEDMPFTGSGIIPDILFNPHGFPSRMTIAMMLEFLAGKAAAINGTVYDASPFKYDEDRIAADHFGEILHKAGYDYHGTEVMFSGITGQQLTADIFIGVVHYQRLRHMVSDKWQVRRTGPIDAVTKQPIKGRSKGGGIRFGEMERDALLAHGCSYLLHDRLFHCSDKSTASVCTNCGIILGTLVEPGSARKSTRSKCLLCKENGKVGEIDVPYIFRFFITQLASCNIKVKMEFKKR